MNSVTIREFQANAAKYLTQLPIILTRYGVPVARISAVEYELKDVAEKISKNLERDTARENLKDMAITNLPKWAESITGTSDTPVEVFRMCQAAGCRAEATVKLTYENPENFEEEVKNFCGVHAKVIKKTADVSKEELL